MNYEEIKQFVRQQSMHETIYEDSEGREILVIRMLEALVLYRKAVHEEREACAQLCDAIAVHPEYASEVTKLAAAAIRARK